MNEIIRLCLPISIGLILMGCSPKMIPSAEVNYVSAGEKSTVVLTSIGYGKKGKNITEEDAAIANSEYNAINAILFRGIPGSDIPNAMIGTNESEIKSIHSKYFDDFYNNKRYRTFIMSSNPKTKDMRQDGYYKIVLELTVNLASLRRDLERSEVIRKFGL